MSNIPVSIRVLEEKDNERLRVWRNANKEFFFSKSKISPDMQKDWYVNIYLKNPDDTIYIVEYESKPVGTLSLTKRGDDYELGRVILGEKRYAKKGIMGTATEMLLKNHLKNGKQRIYLEVIKTNIPAIEFYKKHGFKNIGLNEHGIVMERFV